eukprot:m.826402 g.826402  ORF g.826402 m.826402 type:complete len:394 (-) comp23411_c0_seq6:2482-3663(-)
MGIFMNGSVASALAAVAFGGFLSFARRRWRTCKEYRWYHARAIPKHTQSLVDLVANYHYSPPLWCLLDGSGNIVTLLGSILDRIYMSMNGVIDFKRELLQLYDGGTIGLDWDQVNSSSDDATDPGEDIEAVVVVQHGLCGSSQSVYVQNLATEILKQRPQWRVVVFVARGCGNLELTTPQGFNAARTSDFEQAVRHIRAKVQRRNGTSPKVFAAGFSLGSTLLGKYLGEHGKDAGVDGAVMLSPSWNFNQAPKYLALWSKLYLVKGLHGYLSSHQEMFRTSSTVDVDKALRTATVREFDEVCIVPEYGYPDVEAYYEDASPYRVAHNIRVPTVAVTALDDPVCCGASTQCAIDRGLGDGLVIVTTGTGGHTVWPGGYANRLCLRVFDSLLSDS